VREIGKTGKAFLWAGAGLIVVALAGAAYLCFGHHSPFAGTGPPEKLTIAVSPTLMSAPIYVALDRGYFRQEGLDVSLESFASGKECLKIVLDGKADLATVSDTPIVLTVMAGQTCAVIATIAQSEKNSALVARKDRGISQPADLRGKTIGVTPATSADFFLDNFFVFHGIPKKAATIVPLKPEEMQPALTSGRVDAVATWEPTVTRIQRELGANTQTYYATGIYRNTWNMVASADWVRKRPETVKKLLRALIKAEQYVVEKPAEVQQIVASHLRVEKEMVASGWNDYYFKVMLDQALFVNLESQARWAIQNKLVPATTVPNFTGTLYVDGLKAVRPDAP
jgi:NitT/TauT family transport system substrate-binding protein